MYKNVYWIGTYIINEAKQIREVPKGMQYALWSALQIDISPAEPESALKNDTGIEKLAVPHVRKPCIY